jgi:hypothetical protein
VNAYNHSSYSYQKGDDHYQPTKGWKKETYTYGQSGQAGRVTGGKTVGIILESNKLAGWLRALPPDNVLNQGYNDHSQQNSNYNYYHDLPQERIIP